MYNLLQLCYKLHGYSLAVHHNIINKTKVPDLQVISKKTKDSEPLMLMQRLSFPLLLASFLPQFVDPEKQNISPRVRLNFDERLTIQGANLLRVRIWGPYL